MFTVSVYLQVRVGHGEDVATTLKLFLHLTHRPSRTQKAADVSLRLSFLFSLHLLYFVEIKYDCETNLVLFILK